VLFISSLTLKLTSFSSENSNEAMYWHVI